MNLSELTENSNKQLVIIYPGRFHPFHIGHGKVYKYLKQKYSNAKVFIATSGKVDGDRSPFTFDEKKKMMMLAGVDENAIVQTKSPYQSVEIMERFDENKTVVVFAVSEKDMAEEPRFDFSGGIKLKKNGEPAYIQKWNGLDSAETFATRGYIATTPTFKFKVLGQEINSASQIRNMIAKSDDTKLTQMLQDLYNVADVPQDVIELFKNKIGNKETMNENWDEHSFSEYLKENVIEDNIMKDTILKAITEGKSPHKKGTKRYKAHMAAIHAESIEEEFDRKVKEVVESKTSIAADIKDYVDDHKEHFDAYPMDVEVNGKVYDFDEYWKILDTVYPDSYDNQYTVEGVVTEASIDDLPQKIKDWLSNYPAGEGEYAFAKGIPNTEANNKIINSIAKIVPIRRRYRAKSKAGYDRPRQYAHKDHADTIALYVKEVAKGKSEEQLDEILPALGVAAAVGAVGTAAYKGGKALHKWMSNKNSKMPGDGMAKDAETALSSRKTQMNKNLNTLKNESESKERPYICVHAKKGKHETYAVSSYDAAKNAAEHWGLKSTAGIDAYLADVEHVAENSYHNEQHEMLEYIHHVLQECGDGNVDHAMVEQALEYVEDIREQHFDDEGNTKSESVNEGSMTKDDVKNTFDGAIKSIEKWAQVFAKDTPEQRAFADAIEDNGGYDSITTFLWDDLLTDLRKAKSDALGSTKSESQVQESQGHLDLGNIVGYLDTIDEYVEMLFKHNPEDMTSKFKNEMAYRIQNAVDDIRTRELGLKPSLIRAKYESVNEEQLEEDDYDDGKLRLDPTTGKYDPEEVKQMQKQGAEMARQKANKEMRGKLNRDIDVSKKAHTITVEYDLELDTPKSKNPLLKKHYQLMKKFNVFISMPHWEEGPTDSGFGQWFADVRGSKENLKGWLKAWEYDYDERDYEDMGLEEAQLDEFGPDERYMKIGNNTMIANKKTGSVSSTLSLGGDKTATVNNHFNKDGSQGQISARGTVGGMKFKASNQANGKTPKASVNGVNIPLNASKKRKVDEWVQDQDAGNWSMWTAQERSFIQELCLRHDGVKRDPAGLKYLGKSELWDEGNILKDKGKLTTLMLWVKKNKDDIEKRFSRMFNVYSKDNNNGQSDGNQVLQNIIGKIGKVDGVTEDTLDVTPKGYGPDDYDEKDVAPEDHGGDLKKMQDVYKHNEDRNNHSENILMLAQMFGDRGEIRAVEGLLKVIKRQGYVTPDQSEMMYNAIHKKYYSQLFPTENEGVDGKTYKVKEALTKLIDNQKFVEAGIMHYSDAKGTSEYKEGQKAAKNGEPYDSNPYESGAEKLRWSKGHNEWRHANKRKKGEPNYGARGQFESEEDGVSAEDLVDIITHRIKMNKELMLSLLGDEGPGPLMNAIENVADFYSGTTEVGSSDVSAMVDAVKKQLI